MFAAIHGEADQARLLACASDFSPRAEQTALDTVTLDVSGLTRLFGSAREMAEAIARRTAELGFDASVAVAANPDAAVHGARGFTGITIMEPGREAVLPIDVLDAPPEIADTLALWGVRTFGDLAALPEAGVTERLGAVGAHYHKLARGAGDRPLVPVQTIAQYEAALELEHPVTLLEPLAFILGRLLGEICGRLEEHGLATHELRLSLALDGVACQSAGGGLPCAAHERTIRLPYPMRDARLFLKLLTLDVDSHPPPGPVVGVAIAAEPVNPRVVQHGLFIPQAPEPQKLELTLARIAKLIGEENVGAMELVDTHRPGAFRIRHFAPQAGGAAAGTPHNAIALRMYRPARAARVQTENGYPVRVAARGVHGRVLEAAGPWRTSGDWWREDAWSRDEWDLALSDGALYRIFRDRVSGEWFVEGAYD